jgi:chitinase
MTTRPRKARSLPRCAWPRVGALLVAGGMSACSGPSAGSEDARQLPDAPAEIGVACDSDAGSDASRPDARRPTVDASGDAGAVLRADAGSDASTELAIVVGGYYPNWTASPPRLRDVDPHYNLIYLFAATPVGGSPGDGNIEWTAPGDGLGAATNLVADIAYARHTQGRKIILSIGGAGNDMSFPNRTTSQTFVSSVQTLYAQLGGFDGIDWDSFEGTDPDTTELIWISQQLKSIYPGFMITVPPAPWDDADMTFCSQMASAGALDYCAPQYYDGPGLAEQSYVVSNVAQWVTLLGPSKVVVGFGVWDDQTDYMTASQAVSTWDAVQAATPTLRGAFDWQIDVDYSTGWPFALQVGPLVNP